MREEQKKVIQKEMDRLEHLGIKSKTETPTTKLKTLLLKLSEYTIDLKYQKGLTGYSSPVVLVK